MLLVATIMFAFTTAAHAQLTTADILGTVTDSAGGVIPNATVVLVNNGTHEQRTAVSNADGDYTFSLLQPGHYSVTVKAKGFKVSTTPDLGIEAGDRARNDAHLTPGAESETITVQAQTPLLQADNATVSSTVTEKAVQDLPLNGRNFVQLVQIVPGANEGPGNGLTSGGRPDDRRQSAGFSVNGQDDTLNNYVIDGVDNNERIIGTIGVRPNVEGIQEISVQTNSYAPEAGRTAGGVVNIVTKSGTNQLHGSVYEYFRNDVFDARNAFSQVGVVPQAELRQNQYGASIGGPLWKNHTFFFGDYEGLRLVSGGTTYTSTVPTALQYEQIHSLNGHTPAELIASSTDIPAATAINSIALNYLSLFPEPNAGGSTATSNNYITNPSKTQNSNVFDVRVDHSFTPNNIFFGRYTYNKVNTITPAQLPAVTSGALAGIYAGGGRYNFSGPAIDSAQQFAFGFTHLFSQNLILDLRAAYTRINNQSLPLNYGTDADTLVGFGPTMNFSTSSSYLTPIGINNFPDLGDGAYVPLQDIDNTFQYLGTVSWNKGSHNIKFGASLIRRQAHNLQSSFAAGQYSFGLNIDTIDGDSAQTQTNNLASTLAGAFTTSSRNYDLYAPDYRSWEPSAFIQDNWKATPSLTLIYGLRWDLFTPFTEAHNHISNFDFTQALGSTSDTIASALKIAGVNGVSETAGIKTIYSDFAPRVGFSWQFHPGMVFRGGYGLSFFPGNYTSNADLKNAPFVSVYSPNCESTLAGQLGATNNPVCSAASGQPTNFSEGLPLPSAQTINSDSLSFIAEDPKLRPALIQQFNLQLQQQFGANVFTIGYVGNIGQHLPEAINDINVPAPNAANDLTNPAQLRPLNTLLPNLGGVSWLASGGVSNYSALQTSFQRRFSQGLAFDANYTWGHALSDITGFSEEGQQGWSDADPNHIRQYEYGNAENDIRSRFAITLNYELPFGKEWHGAKRTLLGGWQTNVLAAWQSGKPFTVVNSSAAGGYGNRASHLYNGGVDRPNQVSSGHLSNPSNHEWFDTSAFEPQTLGTVGSEARNALYGPHFRHLDFSVFKDFAITERVKLQFRAEAFDITNTPNYFINNNVNSSPSTLLGNASFGEVTQTDPNYVPRQLQFALRMQF